MYSSRDSSSWPKIEFRQIIPWWLQLLALVRPRAWIPLYGRSRFSDYYFKSDAFVPLFRGLSYAVENLEVVNFLRLTCGEFSSSWFFGPVCFGKELFSPFVSSWYLTKDSFCSISCSDLVSIQNHANARMIYHLLSIQMCVSPGIVNGFVLTLSD